ncbi:phospholipase DDHD1 [Plasmodium brasilianum]|uniref:Phospholipase DDHD1 n=1 Tax=Plasmodium brasilianum TaxID=5824 RepID=A0ACB9Y3M9_PLABR|nr:phospholipase DDHD1 [Plasmodium brasilianum]
MRAPPLNVKDSKSKKNSNIGNGDIKEKKNKNFFFFPKNEKHINKKFLKRKNDSEINFYEEEPYLDDNINDVDYIVLIIHGIGSNEELIINQCEDLKNSFKIVKKMWYFDYPFNIHFHIFNWKKYIIDAQIHVFDRININTMAETRKIINLSAGDIICFLHPRYGDYIMLNLYNDINKTLESLMSDSSGRFRNAKICMLGYSLGSAMAYEILHNVKVRISDSNIRYNLKSKIDYLFTLGSPLSALLSLYKPEYINDGLKLIDGIKFYNIFHGFDPVAFRIEPLIYPKIKNIPGPVLINYWRNNGARYWFEWDKNMQSAKIAIVQNLNDITSAITNGFYKFLGKTETTVEDQGTLNKNICYNKCESKDINMFLLKVKENQRKMTLQKRKIERNKKKTEKEKTLPPYDQVTERKNNTKYYHNNDNNNDNNDDNNNDDNNDDNNNDDNNDDNNNDDNNDDDNDDNNDVNNDNTNDSYPYQNSALNSHKAYNEYSNYNNYHDNDSKDNSSSYVDSTRSICASQDSNSEHSFFDDDLSSNSNDSKSSEIANKEKANNSKSVSSKYANSKLMSGKATNGNATTGGGISTNDLNDGTKNTNINKKRVDTLPNKDYNELPLRYDYQLQEFIMEHYIYPLAVAKSHFNYFIIKDISFFILKELINKTVALSYEDYLTNIEREYNSKSLNEKDNDKKEKYLKISLKASKALEEFRKYEKNMQAMSDPFNMKNFKNLI